MTEARRPRVALVAHDIHDGGGMEHAFAELIRRAHARFDFEVFTAELAPELRPLVTWHRIRVPPRPFPLKFIAFFARAALPIVRTRADLVHVLGAIVPNRADVVSVHYCHAGVRGKPWRSGAGSTGLMRRTNTRIAGMLAVTAERFCYRAERVKVMACVSLGVQSEVEEHYGAIPVALTPNGVDLRRFRPDAAVRSSVRRAAGVVDEVVCLFVGGDWDRKGLAIAITALARTRDDADIHLWVVGRGDTQRFERLAVEYGVGGRVHFLGPRADTERYFQAADILVLPTAYEAAPLVVYEAAASSLPVVATRVNGIEDLVADGESGLLIEREPGTVAAALTELSNDPELRRRMGREGRLRVSEYGWDRSVGSVVRVYDQLLSRSKGLAA